MSLAGDLLGRGAWRLWHLFTLFWILPLALAVKLTLGLEPGAGPQGGEVIFLLFITAVMGLAFVSVVNAALWLATRPRPGVLGRIGRFGLVLVVVTAAFTAWFALMVRAVGPERHDYVAWAGVLALLAAAVAFNAWALVRRARAARS